jgi:hypothetical protein
MNDGIFEDMPTTDEPTTDVELDTVELSPQEETVENEVAQEETLQDSDTPPKQTTFTTEIGGKEVTYTIEGDIEDLDPEEIKLGYLRDRDYTQKRMKDADKIKEVEKVKEKLEQTAEELRTQLLFDQEQLNSKELLELKEYDEDEYIRRVHQHNERVSKFNKWHESKQEEVKEAAAKQAQEDHQKIIDAIPDWLDEAKKKQDVQSIIFYLKEQGVDDQDMGRFYNPVDLPMIRKAMLYDKISKDKLVKNKDKTPPTSTKPNASTSTQNKQEKSLEEIFYGG